MRMLTLVLITSALGFVPRVRAGEGVGAGQVYAAHLAAGDLLAKFRQRLGERGVGLGLHDRGVAYDIFFRRTLFSTQRALGLHLSPELFWISGAATASAMRYVAETLASDPGRVSHVSIAFEREPRGFDFDVMVIDGLDRLRSRRPELVDVRLEYLLRNYLRGDAILIVVDDGDVLSRLSDRLKTHITSILNGSEALRLSACDVHLGDSTRPDESRAH